MSRQIFLWGLGIVLVALAFVLTDQVVSGSPGVTEANCRRIRVGMALREVESILGGPPVPPSPICATNLKTAGGQGQGEFVVWTNRTYNLRLVCCDDRDFLVEYRQWKGAAGDATVYFDTRGKVVEEALFTPSQRAGFLQRLCKRIGW
jgi:hypothetical protein